MPQSLSFIDHAYLNNLKIVCAQHYSETYHIEPAVMYLSDTPHNRIIYKSSDVNHERLKNSTCFGILSPRQRHIQVC